VSRISFVSFDYLLERALEAWSDYVDVDGAVIGVVQVDRPAAYDDRYPEMSEVANKTDQFPVGRPYRSRALGSHVQSSFFISS
jgi:hypothetical protein